MVQVLSLFLAISAVACSGAEDLCVGPSCQQKLDDELSHLLQFRSTDVKPNLMQEESRVSPMVTGVPMCEKRTGGSCQVFHCDGSRNAVCDGSNYECVCGAGLCNYGSGACVPARR